MSVNKKDFHSLKEWKELKEKWKNIFIAETLHIREINSVVEKEKNDHDGLLKVFIQEKLMSPETGKILTIAYGELLYHNLRSACSATCYRPTPLGSTLMSTRGSLKRKLKLIEELFEKGSLEPELLNREKEKISRCLEFLRRVEEFNQKGKSEEMPVNSGPLLLLYDRKTFDIKEDLEINQEVLEATVIIMELMCRERPV